MANLPDAFQAHIESLLASISDANAAAIAAAGAAIGRSVAGGGVLHTFGSGHSEILARELIGRSGGLICVSGIFDPGAGVAENVAGYGARIVERYDRRYGMRAGEVIVVISNSGKNVSPLEVAIYAKEKGLTVVGLCSLAMSRTAPTLHPGGRKLHEIADHVLDNGGVPGDAAIEIEPGVRAGPTSTLTGALLLNQLQLAAIDWMRANSHKPPIFLSQNLPGGEAHNDELVARYRGRLARNF
ncbi:MAG TPA: sugar isomerase domain-containing protein [Opitutaceae bacterium]|nr:sugar isomerase domain-containing protein [Opitutaceae bacterium]